MNKVDVTIRDDNWNAGDCLLVDETPMMIGRSHVGQFFLLNLEDGTKWEDAVAYAHDPNDMIRRIAQEGHSISYLSELHITGG